MLLKRLSLAIPLVVALSACEPPTGTGGGNVNGWPKSDQALSSKNRVEIERHLRNLGYFRGRIDGTITQVTRNAIARYQRSIGAPANGVVSARLLRKLRSSVAAIPAKRKATVTTPKKSKPARTAPAVVPNFSEGDDGGGGGDGGSWG